MINKCEICGREFKTLGAHIKYHNITRKEYYDKYLKQGNEGICKQCYKSTQFISLTAGYRIYCSTKCASLDKELTLKKQNTCKSKYGISVCCNSKSAKQKREKTNLEKYGCKSPFGSDEIQEKLKKTNLDKYGVEYPLQSKEILDKTRDNNVDYQKVVDTKLKRAKNFEEANNLKKFKM